LIIKLIAMKIKYLFINFFFPAIVFAQTSSKNFMTDKIPGSNCDNVVYNKLDAYAQNRSPSGCEVQFDWKVRTALRDAFSKALNKFADDWVIADTAVEVLREIGKETERSFFNPSYYFKMDLNPSSAAYKDWGDKYTAILEELKIPGEATSKKFLSFMYQMNNAIHARFYVLVNQVSNSIYFYKSGQQTITVPGAAYAVKGSQAGALSGGGIDNAMDACLILFGKPKITVAKDSDGGTGMRSANIFPKGTSHLTVQQISIRIECNSDLLDILLKEIDFSAIAAMIGH